MLKIILKPIWRFNIDNTVFIALLTAGSLWLAFAPDASGGFLVGLLWIIGLLAFVSGLGRFVSSYPIGEPAPPRPGPRKRLIFWAGAAALLASSATLFAAGHTVLATIVAIHLFGRLCGGAMTTEPYFAQWAYTLAKGIAEGDPAARRKMILFEMVFVAFAAVMAAGPLWIAFGAPPGWAGNLIVTVWWLILLTLVATFSSTLRVSVENPLPHRLATRIFRIGDSDNIPVIAGSRLVTAYCLFTPVALAVAGMVVPAGLAILFLLLDRANSAQRELVEAADAGRPARLGWFSRANHFIVTNAVLLILSPVRHTSRLLGIGAAREAAELRQAFGRPDGFIYFLWSESPQRVPYLEQGGLLEPYAEHVVERSWRRDIMDGAGGAGGSAVKRAAERRLLARHDVLRKGTPFLVIVPPKGCPRAVRLAGRGNRRWWTGDPNAQTIEFSVLSAVTKAFGPGAR